MQFIPTRNATTPFLCNKLVFQEERCQGQGQSVRLFTIFQVELPLKFERICQNFSSLWLIYINFHQVGQDVLWISLDKLIHVSESEVIRNSQ